MKKSRFIAFVGPAVSAASATAFVAAIRDPSASHSCWAWRVSPSEARRSDDGEPSGTAGPPILAAIDHSALSDAVVVVVRFFGGVKLGAGGLMRAYGRAAREALEEAPKARAEVVVGGVVRVGHGVVGKVVGALKRIAGVDVVDVEYSGEGVTVWLLVPVGAREEVEAFVRDATKGEARFEEDERGSEVDTVD